MSTPTQPRCHLHLPVTDSSGTVFPYASVTLIDPDTSTTITVPAYAQAEGGNPIVFPLFTDPAVIDIWTDEPIRVQILAVVSDNVRVVLDGIDILPPAENILRAPKPILVDGAEAIEQSAVLMSAERGRAVFRIAESVSTHEHEGDSKGSVSLTCEEPADFNPFQTWVGYHAGRNTAPTSTGSSAFGALSELDGAASTIMGFAGIIPHAATGAYGDMATVLSSKDGDATAGSTVIGPGNLTSQGKDMVVIGGSNSPSSGLVSPTGTTVIGSGSLFGAAGAVKIGQDHPTSGAGDNHTSIGTANASQQNGLPWASGQKPYAIGSGSVSLSGDPSNVASATDWFGGAGPLSAGSNAATFNPSIGLVQGSMATQTALRVAGDFVANGHRTWSDTSTTLGFYGQVGTTRPEITYNDNGVTSAALNQVLTALSNLGLIYVVSEVILKESGTRPDGSPLEFAETGQALQWKLPPTSTDYRAANAFTIASNKVILNSALSPFPTNGVPAIYSAGRANVTVQGVFAYGGTTTQNNMTGLMIRCLHEKSVVGGQTVATTKGYLIGKTAVYAMSGDTITSTVTTHSSAVTTGQTLSAECNGTAIVVRANGTQISNFTDSTWTSRVKFGYRLSAATNVSGFLVMPFGF